MKRNRFLLVFFLWCVTAAADLLVWASTSELSVDPVKAAPGQEFSVEAILEPGNRIAGIKLVIEYDANILYFLGAEKLDAANGMMFIVNDRNPGKLIVVMAGAKGIELDRVKLLKFSFRVRDSASKTQKTYIRLFEVEAKNDLLQPVQVQLRSGEVEVIDQTPAS